MTTINIFEHKESSSRMYPGEVVIDKDQYGIWLTASSGGNYGKQRGTCPIQIKDLKRLVETINTFIKSQEQI